MSSFSVSKQVWEYKIKYLVLVFVKCNTYTFLVLCRG